MFHVKTNTIMTVGTSCVKHWIECLQTLQINSKSKDNVNLVLHVCL